MSEMTSDNDVFKKQSIKSKTTPLRRSISTTSLGRIFTGNLNLRDTKSTGEMEDSKSQSSDDDMAIPDDLMLNKKETKKPASEVIETKDEFTNEMLVMSADILKQGSVTHSVNEIAYRWKKDCRTWLWKNGLDMKLRRYRSATMKGGPTKLKEFTM